MLETEDDVIVDLGKKTVGSAKIQVYNETKKIRPQTSLSKTYPLDKTLLPASDDL